MSMRAVLGRVVESIRRGMGTVAVAAAVGLSGGGLLGVGTANAQDCDPVEVAKLLASDGEANDRFGQSVSIRGDTAIIGAYQADLQGQNSGAAYLYARSEGVWTQQAELLPGDGEAGDGFGFPVSLSGGTAVIGSVFDDDNGVDSGSVYVFTHSGGAWTEQAKLLPGDGATEDRFGVSVALVGDTAVIGSYWDDVNGTDSGSVYVFTRSGGVWTQQAKLLASDGEQHDNFGRSVAFDGETAVIGAYKDDDNGFWSGSAYVFSHSGGVWTEQAKLLPADGNADALFGVSVSLSGDTVVIGARADNDNGAESGSAYVFARSGGVWTEQAKLLPGDGAIGDRFGVYVALGGDSLIIGADNDDDNGTDSGSAYLFTRGGGVWAEHAKLIAGDSGTVERFGHAVALDGETVFIGADKDDENGWNSGSAYVFDLNCTACPADLNGDGVVNTQDFLAFLGAWSSGDPLADWDGNGTINTLDFLAYLADWTAGC